MNKQDRVVRTLGEDKNKKMTEKVDTYEYQSLADCIRSEHVKPKSQKSLQIRRIINGIVISISRINNIHELKEKLWQSNKKQNLMNPAMMRTSQNTSGVSENVQLMSEILTKINNAKDKHKRLQF